MQVSGSIRIPFVINGVDGEPGKDAVFYSMESSASALTYYPGVRLYSPETVTFSGYRTEGDETSEIDAGTWWYVEQVSAGGAAKEYWTQGSSVEVAPEVSDFVARMIIVTMCREQSFSSAYDGCRKSVTVNTYCQPRILVWEDQEEGFQFEGGAVGDNYIDTVIYGGNGTGSVQRNMFQCLQTHAKSADTAPPESGTQNEYWVRVTWFDVVATNVLLANYAYINNLVADDVYMETEDGKTAIWINPALAGMLIRKADSLAAKGRENQTAGDWENPTTAFTAGELPDMSALYERKEFSGERADGYLTRIENESNYDSVFDGRSNIGTINVTGALTAGSTVNMTVKSDIRVTIEEGDSTNYSFSQVCLELRCASSTSNLTTEGKYRTLWAWTAEGSGVSGETVTRTKSATAELSFETDTEDLYLRLYYTSFVARSGGNISVEGSFGVSGYCAVTNYVSRYTAGGAFIGLSLQDYLRIGMNVTGNAQHTLLAGGNGVDLTVDGCFQYQGGRRLPFGYALLVGDFTPNGSSLSADYWTFDDTYIYSLTFKSKGNYVLGLPTAWQSTYGFDLSTGKDLCVTATVRRDDKFSGAYAAVDNIENGELSITTHEADGTLSDLPFFLRIDYFPKNKTRIVFHYEEPVVTLREIVSWAESSSSTKKVNFTVDVTLNAASIVSPGYFEISGEKYDVLSDVGTYTVDVPANGQNWWSASLVSAYEIHSADGDINGEVASTNMLVWNGTDFSIR